MLITEQEHVARYEITSEEIGEIRSILKMDGHSYRLTEQGYELTFEFPIFIANSNP